jgi:hypothetical protein
MMIPFIDSSWYWPNSAFAGNGWSAQFILVGPLSPWNWDPRSDPKSPSYFGLNWQNPQGVLKFDTPNPVQLNLGDLLQGFGFQSPQQPVNGPILFGPAANGPFNPVDPLVPGPNAAGVPLPAAAPVGLVGLGLAGLMVLLRRRRMSRTEY